jgi:predicted tellurium resistance membrane protein TerC
MDKYPIVVWIGAAILGRVGAEMIITDPVVHGALHPAAWVEYGVQALGALVVVGVGKYLESRRVHPV